MSEGTVVVGVGSNVGPDNLARIATVSDRLRVVNLAPLLYVLHPAAFRAGQTFPPPPDGPATLAALAAQVRDIVAYEEAHKNRHGVVSAAQARLAAIAQEVVGIN